MAVRFRALSIDDAASRAKQIQGRTGFDMDKILSGEYFNANWSSQSVSQPDTQTHSRSYLKLAYPTFNYVLARSGATLLQKILKIKSGTWRDIVSFKVCMRKDTHELIDVDTAGESQMFLFGPQIAEYYIDQLDINAELINCLYTALGDFVSSSYDPQEAFTLTKTPEDDDIQLVDGWYAHPAIDILDKLKRGRTIDDVRCGFDEALFPNEDSRYTYLRNMAQDKSGLYGMLNYGIMIIPPNLQAKIDNTEHKLTKHYRKVIQANYSMVSSTLSVTAKNFAQSYSQLDRQVSRLQYKNKGITATTKPDDLAIIERVKTKHGQIRKNNLGKRQDYSARSVVCINPYLPIDTIRIPIVMLPKLLEYHILPILSKRMRKNRKDKDHVRNVYDKLQLGDLSTPSARTEMYRIITEEHLLDDLVIILGRQPTLHKLGLQGFYVEPTESHAIEVSPLVCPAFNMDFDGDQAHLEVPLSKEAIREVRCLILTTQNLFLAKTGECTTMPRMDILYGLWLCTRSDYTVSYPVDTYESIDDAFNAVIAHKVKVHETIAVKEYGTLLAGDAAFISCFPKGMVKSRDAEGDGLKVIEITKKTISIFINKLLETDDSGNFKYALGKGRCSSETITGCINHLTELGFKVARLHPLNISLLSPQAEIAEFDNAVDEFHKNMEAIEEVYDLGLETSDNYTLEFTKNLDKLNKIRRGKDVGGVKVGGIEDKLGRESGYVRMVTSGARGSVDNLLQMFSMKGQSKKNSNESFDALLENSYSEQLTPLEANVAAYGGRQGQIDKSLKTADTGYALRRMWHATQGMSIVTNDCGTKDGIRIKKKDLAMFVDSDNVEAEVAEIFAHTVTGRYLTDGTFVNAIRARKLANDPDVREVTMRSPITCACPCCTKCFGVDWSTHRPAVRGTAVGVVTAQSIGEPSTQLTLNTFHSGGVAGQATITSAFDKMNAYITCSNIAMKSAKGVYSGYDPIAWDTGEVTTVPSSEFGKKKVYIGEKRAKSIIVPQKLEVKEYVKKGDGLSVNHGDFFVREVEKYRSLREAQIYLVFKIYSLFKSEVNLKIIHPEVLVASMTRYMILETNRHDLMVGQYATRQELLSGDISNTRYKERLVGVNALTNASHSAVDAISMEEQVHGLSRICLLQMTDNLVKPINRMVFGKSILTGSTVPGYIENSEH